MRSTGASARLTTHQTTSINSGANSATGSAARAAKARARAVRALRSCAIWITCCGVCSV